MTKKYQITPVIRLVKDEASTKFHVKNDDYFGTIASILSLIKQQIKKDGHPQADVFITILKNIEEDLIYLQKNYQIKARKKNKNMIPKGRLTNQ